MWLIYISHTLGQTSHALQLPMSLYGILPINDVLITYYKLSEKIATYQISIVHWVDSAKFEQE